MMQRRDLLTASAIWTAASYSRVFGANERIRIAGLGVGGRATYLLGLAARAENTEIVAVCDGSETRRLAAKEKFSPGGKEYLDYREVLGRNDIDGVVIGAPDHWHVPMTVDAVKAGKDVYVEKPVSHTIEEGERVEKAVLDSKQVVQVGYQQRSWPHFLQAREIVAEGKLGQISLVLTSWYQDYVVKQALPQLDPSKIDWKRFLGSAPDQPFDALRCARWRWFWDFGGGHLTDLYSHYGDVVQWYMEQYAPRTAQATGNRHALPRFECPDTINAAWDYPGFTMVYNGALNGSLDGGKHKFAFEPLTESETELVVGGQYQFRSGGEYHLQNRETISKLQQAVRQNNPATFQEYTDLLDDQSRHLCTLRGLMQLKYSDHPVPLEEVEPAKEIVKRFTTGAMSYGSISKEAHETLAIAMNRLGGMSNTGEGGEDEERFKRDANGDSRRSAVKQVASGR